MAANQNAFDIEQIEELTAKANHINKQLDRSKIEQKRLSTIISICLKNKMQNEAWSNVSNSRIEGIISKFI